MRLPLRLLASLFPFAAAFAGAPSAPVLPAVQAALTAQVEAGEIAGAVTLVVTRDAILHHAATGLADRAAGRPMREDTVFWIASMTKPLTGAAILLLQDEGKLRLEDPVAKHLPEFAALRTPAGRPANLTIAQVLTHTSGLAEAPGPAAEAARTLADLVPAWLAAPMQYEPGARWKYTQSGINVAGRIVERISGLSFRRGISGRA
jgi:CubicO group peptidase (beta-lactamase class C family)